MAVERDERAYDEAFMWFFNDSGLDLGCNSYDVYSASLRDGIPRSKAFWEAIVNAINILCDH